MAIDLASGPLSDQFSCAARPPEEIQAEIAALLAELKSSILATDFMNGEERLRALRSQQQDFVKATKFGILDTTENVLLPLCVENVKKDIGRLSHPEAPSFGRDYLERTGQSGCRIFTDQNMAASGGIAEYTAYSDSQENFGFADRIDLNPNRLDDRKALSISLFHEEGHSLQVRSCAASTLFPRNPNTNVIMHPLAWIRYVILAERDIYAKQGLLAYLLNNDDPAFRENTKPDLISVDNFENAYLESGSLHQALIRCSFESLSKISSGIQTFEHYYQNAALTSYSQAMERRAKRGGQIYGYYNLGADDYYAIGNYGIGPNALGFDGIDSRYMEPLNMPQNVWENLEDICKKYKIPFLNQCPLYQAELLQDFAPTAQTSAFQFAI